jgi:hypothetical protein
MAYGITQAGWRVPTISELESLHAPGRMYPAIDTAAFPETVSTGFWTNQQTDSPVNGWWVNFGIASKNYGVRSSGDRYALRLVKVTELPHGK